MKNCIKKNIFSTICTCVSVVLYSCSSENNNLLSPGGNIEVSIHIEKQEAEDYGDAFLTVTHINNKQKSIVFDTIKLGIETDLQKFVNHLKLISVSDITKINDHYTMVTGKRRDCTNYANEKVYTFENREGKKLDVVLRAYNDGVVFKYKFSSLSDDENIIAEHTTYSIPDGTKRWIQPYDPGYEDFYPLATNGDYTSRPRWNRPRHMWGYPALIEPQNSIFALITEANIMRGHSASRLYNADNPNKYQVNLADEKLTVGGAWESPWRVLIIGSLANIVESTLVTDVSESSKVKDTSWIIPGSVSWIYWAYNNSSNDFLKVKEYIDLAAEMKWPYNLIDWKWDVMGNGGDINNAIQYASDKGVKLMLWYNSSTGWTDNVAAGPLYRLNEKENRSKEYAWLREKGVAGIKVDFFDGDGSKEMNYYIDLLEDAVDYKLMMNFHGSTIPRGWQRTYPHMMTMEAIYGAEWYNNQPVLTNRAAAHNTTIPFTRNVIGPMDYTPGTFSDSQHPHITSHGHELALYVVFESALQHMPDRPSSYESLPVQVKQFLSDLPTAWDDTRLLSGYPGDNVIIARRKGDGWYIGGLNGTDDSKTLSFSLKSLDYKNNTITFFKDGDEQKSFSIEENQRIDNLGESIHVECLPRGGFVAIVK
jgi:Glycoside hydrolase 97.